MYLEKKVRRGYGQKMRNRRKEIKKWRGEEKNKNKIFRDKLSGVYLMMEG